MLQGKKKGTHGFFFYGEIRWFQEQKLEKNGQGAKKATWTCSVLIIQMRYTYCNMLQFIQTQAHHTEPATQGCLLSIQAALLFYSSDIKNTNRIRDVIGNSPAKDRRS